MGKTTVKKAFVSRKQGAKVRSKRTASKAVAVIKDKPSTAVALSHGQLSLADPGQILKFGKVLNEYITKNKLSVEIEGKQYPLCGAWKFAGMNFGLTAIPVELVAKHKDGQYITILFIKKKFEAKRKDGSKYEYEKEVPVFSGFANHEGVIKSIRERSTITREITRPYFAYECKVEVRRADGHLVQQGQSVCSNLESAKAGFDEYAVMGQAQTRTISRALRNLLDFVLNAAGMESTPGEEMPTMDDEPFKEASVVNEQKKTVVTKPTLRADGFDKLVTRARRGEKVLEKAKENLTLTEDQIEVLEKIEKTFKPIV